MSTPLSSRERKYLWFISQGYTPRQVWALLGSGPSPSVATRVKEKLGARTMEHAVFLACDRAVLGPHLECGTLGGYIAHHSHLRDDPCRACRRAFADYAERNGSIVAKVLLTEPERRLLRALDSGRTFRDVVRTWGCHKRTLDGVRTSLYRKLDVAHLPQQSKLPAALETGRKLGYLRPVPVPGPDLVPVSDGGPPPLTELETRTLALLADGTSLSEAGREFGIPGSSVSSRLMNIYKKLGVLDHAHGERRAAAVKEARRQGYAV